MFKVCIYAITNLYTLFNDIFKYFATLVLEDMNSLIHIKYHIFKASIYAITDLYTLFNNM